MDKETTKSKDRKGLYTIGSLMIINAFLFWISDIGIVPALLLVMAGICFLISGMTK